MSIRETLPLDINEVLGTIEKPLETKGKPGTLSVVMIVKNEINNIGDALNSFMPFADGIVINDTGSTDGTREELRKLADKLPNLTLVESEWKDGFHFGNARNQAIKNATSQWCLWLDADDRVPPSEAAKLNYLKTAPPDRAFGLLVINTDDTKQPIGARFLQCRMFPNTGDILFERSIHEQIIYAVAAKRLHLRYVNCVIIHTGYETQDAQKEKAARNVNMSLVDPELEHSPVLMISLGDSHYILGNWDEGIKWYEKAFAFPDLETINGDIFSILPCRISTGHMGKKIYHRAIDILEENTQKKDRSGLTFYEKHIEYSYQLGKCYELSGNYEEATKHYQFAINREFHATSQSSPTDKLKIYSYGLLFEILIKTNNFYAIRDLITSKRNKFPNVKLGVNIV